MSKVAELTTQILDIANTLNKSLHFRGAFSEMIGLIRSKPLLNEAEINQLSDRLAGMFDSLTLKTKQWAGFGGKPDETVLVALEQVGRMKVLIERSLPLAQAIDAAEMDKAALLDRIQALTNAGENSRNEASALRKEVESLTQANQKLEAKAEERKRIKKEAIAAEKEANKLKDVANEQVKLAQQQTIEAQNKIIDVTTTTSNQLVVANQNVFNAQQQLAVFFKKNKQLRIEDSSSSERPRVEEVSEAEAQAQMSAKCTGDLTKLLPKTKANFLNTLLVCYGKANDDARENIVNLFVTIVKSTDLLDMHQEDIANLNMPELNAFLAEYNAETEKQEKQGLANKLDSMCKQSKCTVDMYLSTKITQILEQQKNRSGEEYAATTDAEFNALTKEQLSSKARLVA